MTNNPSQTVHILGAGIAGLMNAYVLSRAGFDVCLYDPKGFPAKNASWIAGGMLAPFSEIEHLDGAWVQAGLDGIKIWQNMDLDTGFNQDGSLLIAHPEDQYILERFRAHLPQDLADLKSSKELEPMIAERFKSGVFLEKEAHLEPQKAMQALSDDVKGRVYMTERAAMPSEFETGWVIDCRGMAAHDKDLRGVKGEIVVVMNSEFSLKRPVRLMHPRYPLYIIPRGHGVFMIGASVIESSDNRSVSLRSAMELMSALYSLHPSFGESEILSIDADIRPSYPDNLPRISVKDNVISCNGLFRHGYLLAPIMAECVKGLIQGQAHKHMSLFTKDQSDENQDQRTRQSLRRTA